MFEVRLLGPVEAWEGGRRAPLGGSRPLAVLGALVVHLGEVVSTERLVDLVWDERAPATAGALVATHVSAVRRALARIGSAEVIRTRPPGYVADLDPAQVDARRFEQLLTAARAETAAGHPARAVDVLGKALGVWRGQEALEGLGQTFARIESARLAELRLVALEESFGLRLELGREDETIAPLLAHVAAHPLRERPRGQLMTALLRTGRVSDALRTYREGRAVLRDELGIDPGPQLRALHRAALSDDPTTALDTPSAPKARSLPGADRSLHRRTRAGTGADRGPNWHTGPAARVGQGPNRQTGRGPERQAEPEADAGQGPERHTQQAADGGQGPDRQTDTGSDRHTGPTADPSQDPNRQTGRRPDRQTQPTAGAGPAPDRHTEQTARAGQGPNRQTHTGSDRQTEPTADAGRVPQRQAGPTADVGGGLPWRTEPMTDAGQGPDRHTEQAADAGRAPDRQTGREADRQTEPEADAARTGPRPGRRSGGGAGAVPGVGLLAEGPRPEAGAASDGRAEAASGARPPGGPGPHGHAPSAARPKTAEGTAPAPYDVHPQAGPGTRPRAGSGAPPQSGPTDRLHSRTLTVPPPRTPPVPSHLPPDIADFVGRSEQIAWAAGLLEGAGAAGRTAPPIGVISGRSGSGKTALAVHVGHRTAELFPDGRLFLDLRAADATPLQPADALARLLRAMGAEPETLPGSLAELTGLYRTHVGHRRVLLILDNAAGEAHVRPLLPPGAGSAVLVTSRRRLVALEGAAHLDLTVPGEEDALELLRRVAGPERTSAEPERAAEIVALCGRLPLAVRIAGARLAARPHWAPGRLAGRLRDERRRLNELSAGDLELRSSLELGYADLDPQERQALRRLALLDLPDFAAWIAAPLLDIGADEAEEAVERLVDCHFIDVIGVDGTGRARYRIHDLAREHARERCLTEESPEERAAAVLRLVACWLDLARKAAARGPGGAARHFPEPAAVRPLDPETEESLLERPAAWFAAEQAGLLAAAVHCADRQLPRAARDLAGALMAGSAALYNQFDAWSRSHTAAMAAVRRSGDKEGEAWLLTGLGQLRYEQDDFDASYAYFADALRLFEQCGNVPHGAALALAGMGTARREQSRHDEALALLGASLERYGSAGDVGARARVLYGIGHLHREQGKGAEARQALTEALELYRTAFDRNGEGLTLRSLALCHRADGELAEAERVLHEALRLFADLRDTFGTMYTEQSLAKVELRSGRPGRAVERLGRCLEVALERQDRFGEALVLRTLGEARLAAADTDAARDPLQRALAVWEELRLPVWRARTLWDLAAVRAADGEEEAARTARAEALEVFRVLGCREARERADEGG
ncbi:BTAD domain-containing putative transcriptional regulator [Streptomyces sp. NPDC005728]|uniref:AfsR/SARP family transcriptional regulator n=1 Tax=Streptomyces sp. NPDC005728 TaxID=3157054 RepID=UPI0033EDFB4C